MKFSRRLFHPLEPSTQHKGDDNLNIGAYDEGNRWQRNRYAFFAKFNLENGITDFTSAQKGKTKYLHIVDPTKNPPEYNLLNNTKILNEVNTRFKSKAGSKYRVLSNTVASQPCCFNIFSPLRFEENRKLRSKLFSILLNEDIEVEDLIIEYTPSTNESIGDQSKYGGTDADVGIFYRTATGKRGVVLIEFKYIEAAFSKCTSYREKKENRPECDTNSLEPERFLGKQIQKPDNPQCGYLRYDNWKLIYSSDAFNQSVIYKSKSCPFRFSLNQLWRNMLLAEQIKNSRNLDEFHFWVVAPKNNKYLWVDKDGDVEENFRNVLSEIGNQRFRKLDLELDIFNNLSLLSATPVNDEWLSDFQAKYLTELY